MSTDLVIRRPIKLKSSIKNFYFKEIDVRDRELSITQMTAFVNELCRDLHIKDMPKVVRVKNIGTQIARLKMPARIIEIRDTNIPNTLFALAHEVRHLWQIDNNKIDVQAYVESSNSLGDYSKQDVEIDANAYAVYIAWQMFGAAPKFDTYSDDVRNAIMDKAKDMIKLHLRGEQS